MINIHFVKSPNSQKCYFHHFVKMSLFTKNHEKFGHLKIWLCHYDFFAISNGLTGAPKNAKICLCCIWHGKPLFLGNFFVIFHVGVKWMPLSKMWVFHSLTNRVFSKFSKNIISIKTIKSDQSWNFIFGGNYNFSKM